MTGDGRANRLARRDPLRPKPDYQVLRNQTASPLMMLGRLAADGKEWSHFWEARLILV